MEENRTHSHSHRSFHDHVRGFYQLRTSTDHLSSDVCQFPFSSSASHGNKIKTTFEMTTIINNCLHQEQHQNSFNTSTICPGCLWLVDLLVNIISKLFYEYRYIYKLTFLWSSIDHHCWDRAMADNFVLGMDLDIKTHEGIFILWVCWNTAVVTFYLSHQGRWKPTMRVN